jgi:dimethylamine/trimethylamine dehydrogenase
VGEEYRRGWHPERFDRAANADSAVLVVGGGVAGMECAIVLGKRGFAAVHLVEQSEHLGGSARRISGYPHLGEWSRLVDWRSIQLGRLPNVEVITGRHLSAEDVLEYGADIVVIATGSRWRRDGQVSSGAVPITGFDRANVYFPEDVAEASGDVDGDRVVVYDTDGYFTSVGMVELLLGQGKTVTVVTPFANYAPHLLLTGEGFRVNRELRRRGVEIVTGHAAVAVEGAGLRAADVWSGVERVWAGDAVVLVTEREPCEQLYRSLSADPGALESAGIARVHRVGDCETPRLLADAIFSGHRLAREIDSDDPDRPLPFLRELPLLPTPVTYPGRPAAQA